MREVVLIAAAALLLDWLFGEPRRFHPLVGFGGLAQRLEATLHADTHARGVLALAVLLTPPTAFAAWLSMQPDGIGALFSIWALYFALGHKSLHDHARPIVAALTRGDETTARTHAGHIVSRDQRSWSALRPPCQ